LCFFFFFQAEDGIRDRNVTGVQTCALPISLTEARGAVFPQRRKDEARQLLARIAPLLAAAGDTAGAQDVLTLLPANERDAIQLEIGRASCRERVEKSEGDGA